MLLVAVFRDHTPFAPDWNRLCATGAALSVNVGTVLGSRSAALLLRQQVFDLFASGQKLTLTLLELGAKGEALGQLETLCGLLKETLLDANAPPSALGLAVDAAAAAPAQALQARCDSLGAGPLYIKVPRQTLQPSFWEAAWRMRGNHLLRLVYGPLVVSQTRLLPDEPAAGIAPESGLQVPTGSAWVTAEIDIAALAAESGALDDTVLEHALAQAVSSGDRLYASIRWPTAQMRHDAWLNRRLAIKLTGIGALLVKRGIDPGRFAALAEMHELLQRTREVLFAATHRLACRDGIVPALDQADPGRLLPGGRIGEGWAWRWRQALEAAAVRNRNVLAISPWSVFPPGEADYRFANLLPVLRHADACYFSENRDTRNWNLKDFKNFHQQAAAVLHQRGAAHQIAVHA
jgi:hypothetical protein